MIMRPEKVAIPVALQIVADDYGWHNGRDERHIGRPSRSGLPRNHAVEDYVILNEIGKALNMKILTPFVIGEWDKNNLLRGIKGATYNEKNWDRASEIDMQLAQKCFEAAEGSEYVEYAYHALLHGYYKDDKQICETEYSRPRFDPNTGKFDMNTFDYISESEMQEYIDLFFRIYDSWGFQKKIRAFVSPCSIHTTRELTDDFASILRKNGLIHWANYWTRLGDSTAVISGVTFMQKGFVGAHWDQYDIEPISMLDQSKTHVGEREYTNPAMGFHWTNFLRLDPQKNMEYLDDWIKYFNRQSEIFGNMLSRDVGFASNQAVYSRYARLKAEDKKYTIDLSEVDNTGALSLTDHFYVSVKGEVKPNSCVGGDIRVYEKKKWHTNYEIKRNEHSKIITFEVL